MSHRMFRVFAILTAIAIAFGLFSLPSWFTPPTTPTEQIIRVANGSTTTVVRLEEDEPGWDCRSMGNGRCGP